MSDFHNHDFSLRQLQYVRAVQASGTFGRAATLCGVSQPALSAQIAKLEAAVGQQLFERGAREVRVTRAGELLLARAAAVLQAAGDLEDAARGLADPYGVVLRVAVIPTVAPYLLPFVVQRLQERTPSPAVHWLELQTPDAEAALAEGAVDGIVIADPARGAGRGEQGIGWEPFVVVVPEDDPAVGPFTVAELSARDVLLLDQGHCLREHTLSLCMEPGAKASPYRGTSLATVVQMVAMGLGVTVLPASAVGMEVGRARVRAVPFEGPAGRELRLVWRDQSAHIGLLRELAADAAAGLEAALARGGLA